MKKEAYFYITVFVALLIVVLGAFILTNINLSPYRHSVSKEGILFVSDSDEVPAILESMKSYDNFIISPEFVEQGPENTYMLSPLTLISAVLIDKEKRVVIVARVVDSEKRLLKCQTNYGDVNQSTEISVDSCNELLSDPLYAKILVSLPDTSLQQPKVELSKGKATVIPSSFENVSRASFVLISSMYSDAAQIINRVNNIVQGIS